MLSIRVKCFAAVLCSLFVVTQGITQENQTASTPRFEATSNLVFLDVTVLDKKGHPVVTGLSKDDFIITEDRDPRPVFSFEAPETHVSSGEDNPEGKAPVTIFVLDELNSDLDQFGYLYDELQRYLAAQPEQLAAPAELMVVGNRTLELLQGYTRSRNDLLFALKHLRGLVPFKAIDSAFAAERLQQSVDALQQIVLQSKDVPGRKNIVWVGHGAPSLPLNPEAGAKLDRLKSYIHATANMLVEARMTLFVIFPPTKLVQTEVVFANRTNAGTNTTIPFASDVNFGDFVQETGDQLFYNRNDIDAEIDRSVQLGSHYYTLTYRPHQVGTDGKFRRIKITMRDPNLRAVTKTGYFSPEKDSTVDPRQKTITSIAEAARAVIPFTGLEVILFRVVRLPESRSAVITLQLPSKSLDWQTGPDGKSKASLLLAAVSRTDINTILASKMEVVSLASDTGDSAQLGKDIARVSVRVQVPNRTRNVRVVVETESGDRVGSVDVSRKLLDSSPAGSVAQPQPGTESQKSVSAN